MHSNAIVHGGRWRHRHDTWGSRNGGENRRARTLHSFLQVGQRTRLAARGTSRLTLQAAHRAVEPAANSIGGVALTGREGAVLIDASSVSSVGQKQKYLLRISNKENFLILTKPSLESPRDYNTDLFDSC